MLEPKPMGKVSVKSLLALPIVYLLPSAQAAAAPGDHIHTGNVEIVPAIQVAGEYRSNPYYEEGGTTSPRNPGFNIWAHPTLDLNLDATDLKLQLGAGYTARKYLTPGLTNLDRFTDVNFSLGAQVLPASKIGLDFSEELRNRARAADVDRESDGTDVFPEDAYIVHFSNETKGQIAIRPGDVLQVDVGGHFDYDNYKIPDGSNSADKANNNGRKAYGPDVDVVWRFFPRSAIVGGFMLEKYNWDNNLVTSGGTGSTSGLGEYIGLPDGLEWALTAGLKGRVTDKVLVNAIAGYGQVITNDDSVTSSDVGVSADELDAALSGFDADLKGFPDAFKLNLELGYSPVETQTVTLGFRKDFQTVFFTNYVDYANVYGRYEGRYFDRLGVLGELTYRRENYAGEITRADNFTRARLDLAWRVMDFLDVGSAVTWSRRTSVGGEFRTIEYDDVAVQIGATLTY